MLYVMVDSSIPCFNFPGNWFSCHEINIFFDFSILYRNLCCVAFNPNQAINNQLWLIRKTETTYRKFGLVRRFRKNLKRRTISWPDEG